MLVALVRGVSKYKLPMLGGSVEVDTKKIEKFRNAIEKSLKFKPSIVVTPEYAFFPNVPFTEEEKEYLYEEFTRLSKKAGDMLILAGTVLWYKNKYLRNTLPVFLEGELIYEYDKREVGDDIEIAETFGLKFKRGNKAGFVRYKNIVIGLEICQDHTEMSLRKQLEKKAKSVDLQIVVACGMRLIPSATVIKSGGYAMITNGNFKGVFIKRLLYKEFKPHTEVLRKIEEREETRYVKINRLKVIDVEGYKDCKIDLYELEIRA